jgi:hypothetical protein
MTENQEFHKKGIGSLDCEAVTEERLRAYATGNLSRQEAEKMDEHLDRCEICTARLDALMDADPQFQITPEQQVEVLRWLYTTYPLDEEEERRGIETILANARRTLSDTPEAQPVPVWASEEWQMAAESSTDITELDRVRKEVGAAFEERGSIELGPYTGKLFVRDRTSAQLKFRKGGRTTFELDGQKIWFYVGEKSETPESGQVEEIIEQGSVIINFEQLGISIREFAKVRFRIAIDPSTVVEGSLGKDR